MLFLGGQPIKKKDFLSVLAFKTIDTHLLFDQYFWKRTKKPLLTANNGQNSVFLCIFKNTDQKNICASIVFKAES